MGYYTRFRGRILDPVDAKTDKMTELTRLTEEAARYGDSDLSMFKDEFVTHIKKIQNIFSSDRIADILGQFTLAVDDNLSEAKWYDHEKDMKILSGVLPDYLFELSGEGEEAADIWTKWFLRGQMQGGRVQIIKPSLDLSKFKDKP